jgi:hypothetical protein
MSTQGLFFGTNQGGTVGKPPAVSSEELESAPKDEETPQSSSEESTPPSDIQ